MRVSANEDAVRSSSERRVGVGLALFGVGGSAVIALAPVAWHLPLLVISGALIVAGLWLVRSSARAPQPNLAIALAMDYLVNDSTATLRQNAPPEIATFGPAKGHVVSETGKPQQDALLKIEEQLGFGTLIAFGRRALVAGEHPHTFDPVLRVIPRDYWNNAGLNLLFARILEEDMDFAQTQLRFTTHGPLLYGDLRLDRRQVRALWKPKPLWRRLWERRILSRQRIRDRLFDLSPHDDQRRHREAQ